jgi:hypothetical protein
VWSFLLGLFVCLGTHIANLPCVVFGCPSCQAALPCPWSPNLGQAVLKYLPRSQNWFLSIIQLIFFPSAPLCGHFHYGSSCVSLHSLYVWVPILTTSLVLCLGAPPTKSPCLAHYVHVFRYDSSCVWAPMPCEFALCFIWAPILRTRLVLHSGAKPW